MLVFLTAISLWNSHGESNNFTSSFWFWIGVLIGVSCIVFSCISIRCPVCGARWFWLAVSRKHGVGGIDWFLSQQVCPVCGYSGKNHEPYGS